MRLEEIETEWRAQIQRILAAGLQLDHLDSHFHVHVLPRLLRLTVRLASEFGIDFIRLPTRLIGQACDLGLGSMRIRAIAAAAQWSRRSVCPRGLHWTDAVLSLSHVGPLGEESLKRLLTRCPQGTTEMICHVASTTRPSSRFERSRVAQAHFLLDCDFGAVVSSAGLSLSRFADMTRKCQHPKDMTPTRFLSSDPSLASPM